MIGVNVTFDYDGDFDRSRVSKVAENARTMFEGMPGLRFKFFTFDEKHERPRTSTSGILRRRRSASFRTSCVSGSPACTGSRPPSTSSRSPRSSTTRPRSDDS